VNPPVKTSSRIAFTCALILAMSHSLRAEFLVLKIRETTAESIWHWMIAVFATLIFFTLRASRSKGGQGR
jgi:hypothetical protein